MPSPTCGGVPDVSLFASAYPGATQTIDLGAPLGIDFYGASGTSYASPLFATGIALVDARLAEQGLGPVGLVTPLLYRLAAMAAAGDPVATGVLRDITEGTNDPDRRGVLHGRGPGYDLASGLGSPALRCPGRGGRRRPGPAAGAGPHGPPRPPRRPRSPHRSRRPPDRHPSAAGHAAGHRGDGGRGRPPRWPSCSSSSVPCCWSLPTVADAASPADRSRRAPWACGWAAPQGSSGRRSGGPARGCSRARGQGAVGVAPG